MPNITKKLKNMFAKETYVQRRALLKKNVGSGVLLFLGNDERLTITHEAENKSVFVHGALKAAAFILDKPCGLYSMNDLLV